MNLNTLWNLSQEHMVSIALIILALSVLLTAIRLTNGKLSSKSIKYYCLYNKFLKKWLLAVTLCCSLRHPYMELTYWWNTHLQLFGLLVVSCLCYATSSTCFKGKSHILGFISVLIIQTSVFIYNNHYEYLEVIIFPIINSINYILWEDLNYESIKQINVINAIGLIFGFAFIIFGGVFLFMGVSLEDLNILMEKFTHSYMIGNSSGQGSSYTNPYNNNNPDSNNNQANIETQGSRESYAQEMVRRNLLDMKNARSLKKDNGDPIREASFEHFGVSPNYMQENNRNLAYLADVLEVIYKFPSKGQANTSMLLLRRMLSPDQYNDIIDFAKTKESIKFHEGFINNSFILRQALRESGHSHQVNSQSVEVNSQNITPAQINDQSTAPDKRNKDFWSVIK